MLEFKNVLKVKNGDHYEEIPALKGSDASVTSENIATALGYTPADADDVTELSEDIAQKLTEPSSGLAVGKYFRIASIDASGHAVLEACDAPATDVQINGTSITQDGVANINAPVNAGGVKYVSIANLGKVLSTDPADSYWVSRRYGGDSQASYKPLTPKFVGEYVKGVMTDGLDPAWTSTEQAAARSRMGASGAYRHIATVTVTDSNAYYAAINTDSNGNPFELVNVIVTTSAPKKADDDTTADNGYFTFGGTNDANSYYGAYTLKGTNDINVTSGVFYCGTTPFFDYRSNVASGKIAGSSPVYRSFRKDVSIQKVSEIRWRGNGKITVGTIFDVWGIDA